MSALMSLCATFDVRAEDSILKHEIYLAVMTVMVTLADDDADRDVVIEGRGCLTMEKRKYSASIKRKRHSLGRAKARFGIR